MRKLAVAAVLCLSLSAGAAEPPVTSNGTAAGEPSPPSLACVPDRISVELRWGMVGAERLSLENTGEQPLDWRLVAAPPWLNVSDHGGALAGGESRSLSLAVDAARLGPGARYGSLVLEAPGTEVAPLAVPVSVWVHTPVFGVRLGVSTFPEAEYEVKPRRFLGLSLYPLRAACGRVELGLSYAPDAANPDRRNYYTELTLDWMQLAGASRSAYWSVGAGMLYDEQGTRSYKVAAIRGGGGVRFGSPWPWVESYVGGTLDALTWSSTGFLNAHMILSFYCGIAF